VHACLTPRVVARSPPSKSRDWLRAVCCREGEFADLTGTLVRSGVAFAVVVGMADDASAPAHGGGGCSEMRVALAVEARRRRAMGAVLRHYYAVIKVCLGAWSECNRTARFLSHEH